MEKDKLKKIDEFYNSLTEEESIETSNILFGNIFSLFVVRFMSEDIAKLKPTIDAKKEKPEAIIKLLMKSTIDQKTLKKLVISVLSSENLLIDLCQECFLKEDIFKIALPEKLAHFLMNEKIEPRDFFLDFAIKNREVVLFNAQQINFKDWKLTVFKNILS
jgi:hypothetical protein